MYQRIRAKCASWDVTSHMPIPCWLYIMYGLVHYVICLGGIEQLLLMTNNIITLGYTYAKLKLNKPPNIFYKLTNTGQIISSIPSRTALTEALQGREGSLHRTIHPTSFSRTNNQEGATIIDTSTWYTLWESGWTRSINPYFDFYTQYKPLDKCVDTEVNGIGFLIKPKGIITVALDL